MWLVASIPFFLLGAVAMVGACDDAKKADATALRLSVANVLIWLVVAGVTFSIAAKVVS